MSRDVYGGGGGGGGVVGGSGRSPRPVRRDLSADPYYQDGPRAHSPGAVARRSRSATRAISPSMALDPHSSYMEPHGGLDPDRRTGSAPGTHHRSRSQSRTNPVRNYHPMDREPHDREFMPIRDPRDRSMERGGIGGGGGVGGTGGAMDMHGAGHMARRDRSLDRGGMMEDDLYRDHHGLSGRTRTSPNHSGFGGPNMNRDMSRDPYLLEVQMQNSDMQKELGNLKKELELTNQKLGSSMHSIKTFWSPELKKERALRKEESAKYSLITDQLKLLNSENQKQAMLVRQLEEELRMTKLRGPSIELQSQIDTMMTENEHYSREANILRETIKELELRIETQKQTLSSRDESIKKLLEMLQQKGMGDKFIDAEGLAEVEQTRARLLECQNELDRTKEALHIREREVDQHRQLEEARQEMQKRDQELLGMSAKMKTLEEQHQDYTRHIMVLKESLLAKEEHYTMLQADVEELRQRLEEKNKQIEKKTQQALQATQERNRLSNETNELRDHMDIKDRKINVLQRKLDLHDANKQLEVGGKTSEELNHVKRQLEEQMKTVEQKSKNLENRNKQLDEREKTLSELETRLQKKKEQLNNFETQLQQAASAEGVSASEASQQLNEMRKVLGNQEQQIEALIKDKKLAEDNVRTAQSETERLLQVMQMGQEEQFSKDKNIKDLQDALKAERMRRGGPVGGQAVGPTLQGGPVQQQQQHPQQQPTKQQHPQQQPTMQQPQQQHPQQQQQHPPQQQQPHKPESLLDGIAAPLTGSSAANLAATAAGKATATAQEAAKATLEQAKNVAQKVDPKSKELLSKMHQGGRSLSQHKLQPNEILILEMEGREREYHLNVDQMEVDIKLKDSLIQSLTEEGRRQRERMEELEDDIHSLEEELKKSEKLEELEELVVVVKQKNERIEDLEEALKQSVRMASDIEMEKKDEEERRKEITEKLEQLESRLVAAQSSQSLKCTTCNPLRDKLQKVETRLEFLLKERRKHLEELFDMKHEALTTALSEKDAHIALLEMGAIKPSKAAPEIHNLTKERDVLNNKIKNQSEERVKLLQEFAAVESVGPTTVEGKAPKV